MSVVDLYRRYVINSQLVVNYHTETNDVQCISPKSVPLYLLNEGECVANKSVVKQTAETVALAVEPDNLMSVVVVSGNGPVCQVCGLKTSFCVVVSRVLSW